MKTDYLKLAPLLLIASFILAGCSFFGGGDDEIVYPPGIITPTPEAEEEIIEEEEVIEEEPTPEVTELPSPTVSPEDMDEDDTEEEPDTAVEGDYSININSAEVEQTNTGISVDVEGEYLDNCTIAKYSWEIQGSQIMITIGQTDPEVTDCLESTKPYSANIELNYSFDEGQEYTVVANGFESEPFVYGE